MMHKMPRVKKDQDEEQIPLSIDAILDLPKMERLKERIIEQQKNATVKGINLPSVHSLMGSKHQSRNYSATNDDLPPPIALSPKNQKLDEQEN